MRAVAFQEGAVAPSYPFLRTPMATSTAAKLCYASSGT